MKIILAPKLQPAQFIARRMKLNDSEECSSCVICGDNICKDGIELENVENGDKDFYHNDCLRELHKMLPAKKTTKKK